MVYRQAQGDERALIYLETPGVKADIRLAEARDFIERDIAARYSSANVKPNPDRATIREPAVEVESLALPGAEVEVFEVAPAEGGMRYPVAPLGFHVRAPEGTESLVIAFPHDLKVLAASVNGAVAIDEKSGNRAGDRPRILGIAYPGSEPLEVVLQLESAQSADIAVTTRLALPQTIVEEYRDNWPADAQTIFNGSRAEVVEEFRIGTQ